jgi:signal transduction histidine kinase
MNEYGYAVLGLTAMIGMLVAVVAFAFVKFIVGVRQTRKRLDGGEEATLLSSALQDAMIRLQEQERAMSARAVASEQLSGQIVESITAGLLVVDAGGRVEILNPAGRRLLDVTAEPVGLDYRALLAGAPALRDAVTECLATRGAIVRRSLEVARAGRPSHFGVTVSPLGGPAAVAGEAGGAICLFSDLTNVFELEEQLRLKETLARLGELTAGIAHEFRNGLATIHGYSRLVVPDELPPAYRPYIEAIRQETELLGQVVTNFLNFARPEKVVFTPVDLGVVVRRAFDDLRHELPAGTTLDVKGEFCEVAGDDVLLRQVFGNLLRNAAEACDGAGVEPVIAIEAHIDRARQSCHVSVTDNGPGIPESARDRVFQPFFTTRSRGTGLGLAIVQKIVVTHNGRVSVGEPPEGGARIEMTFPMAAA